MHMRVYTFVMYAFRKGKETDKCADFADPEF